MVFFHTHSDLYDTAYAHSPTTATDGQDHRVREAWYGDLIDRRSDEQRLAAGQPHVEEITRLTVWPGRLSGLVPLADAKPAYPGATNNYPRPINVTWPRLADDQWLQLADAARPHAPGLAAGSSHDAMLHLIDLAHRLDLYLLPQLSEISSAECDCRSRKTLCEHIAALIERYARSLDHEPLTLLLLGGCAAGDFFAILDDPEHPSTQPYYRPKSLEQPHTHARYRWQWDTPPPLPPLPVPPAVTDGPGQLSEISDPAHQLLARAAADRAADLLRQAVRGGRYPVADPIQRLSPGKDANRLTAYQSPQSEAPASA
jgi:uncharacterized Zn finger protein